MRIGILGGTFDPPHKGHLIIAEQARRALDLGQIYFVPARQPPHKLGLPITPVNDRLAMLRLAVDGHSFFSISLVEVKRPGPSYTVDTLRELRREFPPSTELYFIEGMDSLVALPTWHQPKELIQLCYLAVLKRPGYELDMDSLEDQVPGVRARVVFIPAPEIEISSHEIQARCRAGQSLHDLVPGPVEQYIAEHHLYEEIRNSEFGIQ